MGWVRAITYVESNGYRIFSRPGNDITRRYPELSELSRLPPGTVLDGEIVVPDQSGKAHLNRVMPRVHAQSERSINQLTRSNPAVYVVFDQLFSGYQRITRDPFEHRRDCMRQTVRDLCRTIPNDGLVGNGTAYFKEILSRGIEGMVAKSLDGKYQAGKRASHWLKVKTRKDLMCVVIGFTLDGRQLDKLLAADVGGGLRHEVVRVEKARGSNIDRPVHAASVNAASPSGSPFVLARKVLQINDLPRAFDYEGKQTEKSDCAMHAPTRTRVDNGSSI